MRRILITFVISSAGAILFAGSTGDLFSAVAAGSVEQIRELVAKGLDVNAADEEGRTALMNAAESGQGPIAVALVEAGADLNTRSASGDTALIYAVSSGNAELVDELLKRRADPNISTPSGTALHKAAELSAVRSAELLIARGARPEAQDEQGRTALFLASRPAIAQWRICCLRRERNPTPNRMTNGSPCSWRRRRGDSGWWKHCSHTGQAPI